MEINEFNSLASSELDAIASVLIKKGGEYTFNADRLDCFKKAGHLQHVSATKALVGFLTKHVISVYDMIESGKSYPQSVWDEKIHDVISYMILLQGVIRDDGLATDSKPVKRPIRLQEGKADAASED